MRDILDSCARSEAIKVTFPFIDLLTFVCLVCACLSVSCTVKSATRPSLYKDMDQSGDTCESDAKAALLLVRVTVWMDPPSWRTRIKGHARGKFGGGQGMFEKDEEETHVREGNLLLLGCKRLSG